MTRRGTVAALLNRYGNSAVVRRGDEEIPVRALIQPLNQKNKEYPDEIYLPEGYFDNSHYFYLGPAEPVPEGDGAVLAGAVIYDVRRARQVLWKDRPIYTWAVLQAGNLEEVL